MAALPAPARYAARWLCAVAALATLSGCASAGESNATSVEALGLLGSYRFEYQLEGTRSGHLVLTAQDRYQAVCDDDRRQPPPPQPVSFGPGSVRVRLCGTPADVRLVGDGRVQATLTYRTSRSSVGGETCEVWNYTERGRVCVSRGTSTRSVESVETQVIELVRISD